VDVVYHMDYFRVWLDPQDWDASTYHDKRLHMNWIHRTSQIRSDAEQPEESDLFDSKSAASAHFTQ